MSHDWRRLLPRMRTYILCDRAASRRVKERSCRGGLAARSARDHTACRRLYRGEDTSRRLAPLSLTESGRKWEGTDQRDMTGQVAHDPPKAFTRPGRSVRETEAASCKRPSRSASLLPLRQSVIYHVVSPFQAKNELVGLLSGVTNSGAIKS